MASRSVGVHAGKTAGSFVASASVSLPKRSSTNATIERCTRASASMRVACARTSAAVASLPCAAASKSTSSGTEPHSAAARRDATSKSVYLTRPLSAALGAPSSTRYRKLGDCRIAHTAWRMPARTLLPGLAATVIASVTKRIVSASVSVRRNARRPNAARAFEAQAVSVVPVGMQESTAAARVASENA